MRAFQLVLAAIVLAALAVVGLAGEDKSESTDWPQFRGPARDGVSAETGLLASWPESGPPERWRTELGEGYSGIARVGNRLYTMFGKDKDEFVVCIDAASGEEIWRVRTDANRKDQMGSGPRSTPTVDEGVVYALGALGGLHALRASDGQELWKRDLKKDFDAAIPSWGVSTSPLVEGELLLVDVGGKKDSSIVAFDKQSGKEIWRSQDDLPGYSAPLGITVGEQRQIVFFTGRHILAVAPKDGSLLWKQTWKTSYDVNAATPVFIPPNKLFVSSGYDVGSALLQIRTGGVEEIWKSREMRNKFSSSVLHEGHLYGFDEKTLKCIEAATGEMKWQARGLGHGSLLYADNRLIVLGEQGTLVLVDATPEVYREHGRVQVFDGKTWTMPTLSGGMLYLRDEKELVALDVSG